ncbi:MAG TPA: molybdopterin cofactor-binding domain-containing protein [Methylomirabilota bacterium]|jgi:isoquinoline 1-oxidoreductase beta subunit|nr:molybdopterin cofactor-binding domain-containing protein [Methylomirabilota bacterium]
MATVLSRRAFVAGSAAGLTFTFTFTGRLAKALAQAGGFAPNIWVTIAPDGTITIVAPAVEMGQGAMTGMPLVVAEELDADWSKVKIRHSPQGPGYGNPGFGGAQVTGASRSTPGYWMPLRLAGAQARRVLLDAAAERLGVPVGELTTEPSVVVHKASGRRLAYGEIAQFAKAPATLPTVTAADLKKTSEFRLIGKNHARIELPEKVTGAAKFGIDQSVPDMLIGGVLRAPVPGSKPEKIEDAAALSLPGVVKVVALPYGVGVVGLGYQDVQKGKNALKVTWSKGAPAEKYDSEAVVADYVGVAASVASKKGVVAHQAGDVGKAFNEASRRFTGVYVTDHVYHATMEPMNATAWVKPDSVELWVPTQSPTLTMLTAAALTKLPPTAVKVNTTLLGGGFGRRLEQDFTSDAVLLSKEMGRPVKVIWSREDDVKNDKLRPLTAQYLEAATDDAGNVTAWRYRIAAPSIYARANPRAFEAAKGVDAPVLEGFELSYAVPNQMMEYLREERGWDVGFWRSVGAGYTKFAIESFLDEIARAHKLDPVAFRLKMLAGNPRAAAVVKKAAEMADWDGKRPAGRALGIGFSDTWRSYIATVAEVSVNRQTGKISVHKLWSAVDPGIAILPDNVVAQIEGAAVFGVSSVLGERITVKDGQVQQSNFHDYTLLRMADCPEIQVEVMATDNAPGGIGEVGLPPTGPAIGNAIAALTGVRLRRLPMTPARVLAALKERV